MDLIDYQKYDFVHYRVNYLLREWKNLKLHFEAKLAMNISPPAKYIYIHSLCRLAKRLDKAQRDLKRIKSDFNRICKANGLGAMINNLFYKPNIGYYLRNIALRVTFEITILQKKIEGKDNTLSFKALPYEFQSRLVALLPLNDLLEFKLAGKTAAKLIKQRGMISKNLFVVRNSTQYEMVKESYGWNPVFDISNVSCFLKLNSCHVRSALCLILGSPEKYDHAVKIVTGTYNCLNLRGVFTWRQAIHFMNVSKNIKYATLYSEIQLDEEDFDNFFEAVVQCLLNHKKVFIIDIYYDKLDLTFGERFKTCIESRTNFHVTCSNFVAICKRNS